MGLLVTVLLAAGCGTRSAPNPQPVSRYPQLPPRQVPSYLEGSVLARTDLIETEPFVVSGYGLVVNLRGTGDSTAPTAVREEMIREMVKRGVGSKRMPGYENRQPEALLRDPRVAIVHVEAAVPPGARQGQRIDVRVAALPQNQTTSLANGDLYLTDLTVNGQGINPIVHAQGPVFVNPAYAVQHSDSASARASLRQGTILNGGSIVHPRPLVLRLRQPQRSVARAIERRINERFQSTRIAIARDEGEILLHPPAKFRDDWEHFAGVVKHLFLDSSSEFVARKAQQLTAAALEPDAPLLNISFAFEALGPEALPFVRPLMTSQNPPDVIFAAARAAAFLNDESAPTMLMQIARTADHPFQVNAVQVLGALPNSPAINQEVRRLLNSEQTLVRIEAYRVLARHRDSSVTPTVVRGPFGNDKFILDIVPSNQPPIIYASRSGWPRIALIGPTPEINLPVVFMSMDRQFSLSSNEDEGTVRMFYRGSEMPRPVTVESKPDLAEVIARLGGEGGRGEPRLNFNYSDVVGLLQAMVDAELLSASRNGRSLSVAFVLQESQVADEGIEPPPFAPPQPAPRAQQPEAAGSSG